MHQPRVADLITSIPDVQSDYQAPTSINIATRLTAEIHQSDTFLSWVFYQAIPSWNSCWGSDDAGIRFEPREYV